MANDLVITFKGDTADAMQKIGGLKGALGGLGSFASGALKAGLFGAAAGATALAGGLAVSVKAAMDAELGQKALSAVLESTGGKAGVTAEMANELASSLQEVTRFEDDTVLATENLLLTFTNLGKDIFPEVTEMALDMATAMGTDTKSAAIQLGKALNDPKNGMTALTRVGVTFTEAQKKQIEALQDSGDLLGAQKVILKELQVEFGGAARAAGDTFAGKLDILQNKFGDIQETIGGALLPLLTTLADKLIELLNSEPVVAFIDGLAASLEKLAAGDIRGVLADIFGEGTAELILSVSEKLKTIVDEALPKLQQAAEEIFPKVGQAISDFWTAAKPQLDEFGGWLNTDGVEALQVFMNKVSELESTTLPKWNTMIEEMGVMWNLLFGPDGKIKTDSEVTLPKFADLVEIVLNRAQNFIDTKLDLIRAVFTAFNDALRGDWNKLFLTDLPNILSAGFDAILGNFMQNGKALRQSAQNMLDDLTQTFVAKAGEAFEAASNFMQGIYDGLNSYFGDVMGIIQGIIDAINSIPFFDTSGGGGGGPPPASPPPASDTGRGGADTNFTREATVNVYATVRSNDDIDRLTDMVSARLGTRAQHRIARGF